MAVGRVSRRSTMTATWVTGAFAAILLAGAAQAGATVSGPIPGDPIIDIAKGDQAAKGYVTEEYVFSGTAQAYRQIGAPTTDGRWQVEPAATAPFKSRLIVQRPSDPKKFNGTVYVEWLNVSGGRDSAPDWKLAHREILRSGAAWVGVSAQKVGIEGGRSLNLGALPLKKMDPARYGELSHPGDAFCFDIFSQGGQLARNTGDQKILGALAPKRMLAIGESQSAIYLTTYVNAVDPVAKVFDGFVIHSRFGGAPAVEAYDLMDPANAAKMPKAVKLRDDLRAPVITVITETDLMSSFGGFLAARQPDSDRLRIWEVPGASHADSYMLAVSDIDNDATSPVTLAATYLQTTTIRGAKATDKPFNFAPQHHYIVSTALSSLDRWVKTGVAPPHGAPMATVATGDPAGTFRLALDANGNARGGIRTPWMDVPFARLSGLGNSGGTLSVFVGTSEVFDQATLDRLYPGGRKDYLQKFDVALARAVKAGFILKADEADIRALAVAMYPGAR